MALAAMGSSNEMQTFTASGDLFTRDLMQFSAGHFGKKYFNDLENGTSTWSDATEFAEAATGMQMMGDIGADLIYKGFGVAKNVAGMFGGGNIVSQLSMRAKVLKNAEEIQAGNDASNFGIHVAVEQVPSLDISVQTDESVFWSGPGNRELAEDYSVNMRKSTLGMTPGGQYFESLDLSNKFAWKQAAIPWDRLSLRFAEEAFGEISVFVKGARPDSIFVQTEEPALRQNSKVTRIIYSPEYIKKNSLTQ